MQVIKSSLPVLMSVAAEVRTKKKSEPRKKRAAGSEVVLAGRVVAAMAVKFQSSTGGRGRGFRAAQTITLRRGLRRSLWSWRERRGRFCACDWKSPAKRAQKGRKGSLFSPQQCAPP